MGLGYVVKQYVVVGTGCLVSLFAGASTVHALLRPDLSLNVDVERAEAVGKLQAQQEGLIHDVKQINQQLAQHSVNHQQQ
mmetsp:Transcript_1590/g.3700  ORF Transcript_1590/g.3700 Transcript_1590/m.3700 type:complete len:80 (+) Transcript_1590:246-485(+)